jgi:hypothetical protein
MYAMERLAYTPGLPDFLAQYTKKKNEIYNVLTYKNNAQDIYQFLMLFNKMYQNSTTIPVQKCSIPSPLRMYQNRIFGTYTNIPSGNPDVHKFRA